MLFKNFDEKDPLEVGIKSGKARRGTGSAEKTPAAHTRHFQGQVTPQVLEYTRKGTFKISITMVKVKVFKMSEFCRIFFKIFSNVQGHSKLTSPPYLAEMRNVP